MEHTSQSELESNKVDAREALAEDRDAWRLRLRLRLDVRLEELLVDVLDELFSLNKAPAQKAAMRCTRPHG